MLEKKKKRTGVLFLKGKRLRELTQEHTELRA